MIVCMDKEQHIANGSVVYVIRTLIILKRVPKDLAGCKYSNSKNSFRPRYMTTILP
jgi:hypothetical protein